MHADVCNTYFCHGLGDYVRSCAAPESSIVIAGNDEATQVSLVLMPPTELTEPRQAELPERINDAFRLALAAVCTAPGDAAAYNFAAMPRKAVARVVAEEKAAIDREWLKLFVDFAQGDPRLTAWEEAFVASMRHYAYRTGHYTDLDPGWRLSHKQLAVCHQIDDKLQVAELELPVCEDLDDELPLAEGVPLHDAEVADE